MIPVPISDSPRFPKLFIFVNSIQYSSGPELILGLANTVGVIDPINAK